MATNILLGTSIILTFIALILVCLGFSTDHWLEVSVKRSQLKSDAAFDNNIKDHITGRDYLKKNDFKIVYIH